MCNRRCLPGCAGSDTSGKFTDAKLEPLSLLSFKGIRPRCCYSDRGDPNPRDAAAVIYACPQDRI